MPEEAPLSFSDILKEEYEIIRGITGDATEEKAPVEALCISGGGIRSATFGLGALQGLAEKGVLTEFDYLSTVSGGGYIGSWLTCWKHGAGGLDKIIPKLRPRAPKPQKGEIDPIEHLREYNNYLSPRFGFFSADTWTLVATVVRNMTLNWLVLVPLLMFVLMVPRLILAVARAGETFLDFYGPTAGPILAAASNAIPIVSGVLFAISIFNTMRYLPGVGGENHGDFDFLKYCLAPLILSTLAFISYDSWFYSGPAEALGHAEGLPSYGQLLVWIEGSCAAGWIAYLLYRFKSRRRRVRLFLLPLTFAVALMGVSTATAAWLLVTKVYTVASWPLYVAFGPPLLLVAFMAAAEIFVGLSSRVLEDEDREWLSRGAAWVLLFIIGWAGICSLVLLAPTGLFLLGGWWRSSIAAAGGLCGWICAAGGYFAKFNAGTDKQKSDTPVQIAMNWVAKLTAPIFVIVFLTGLSVLTNLLLSQIGLVAVDWTHHEDLVEGTRAEVVFVLALAFLALGWFAARYININKFSLHAMYRNRLIRAYLGASNNRSKANKFTGFAETDNIPMHRLTASLKPFHVVNMTLNLVSGERLAWQQRKAESFTVTAIHCGSSELGYRPSTEFGGPDGISLGGAIAISGAAASPNQGYHSSPVIGFIMTLFNARLGAWFGNPGKAGARTWREPGPRSAVGSLVREAFGLTNDTSPYVYLSDGGHFENLGLYEMILRGCERIVVLDSGCDPTFIYEDLGNALRKIRIDMGIPIEFTDAFWKPLRDGKKRCAVATIGYSAIDPTRKDGQLLYIKPIILGNESPDISTYKASHPTFPHEDTSDQFYNESQTESYRMLGLETIMEICAGWDSTGGLKGMIDHASNSYLAPRLTGTGDAALAQRATSAGLNS